MCGRTRHPPTHKFFRFCPFVHNSNFSIHLPKKAFPCRRISPSISPKTLPYPPIHPSICSKNTYFSSLPVCPSNYLCIYKTTPKYQSAHSFSHLFTIPRARQTVTLTRLLEHLSVYLQFHYQVAVIHSPKSISPEGHPLSICSQFHVEVPVLHSSKSISPEDHPLSICSQFYVEVPVIHSSKSIFPEGHPLSIRSQFHVDVPFIHPLTNISPEGHPLSICSLCQLNSLLIHTPTNTLHLPIHVFNSSIPPQTLPSLSVHLSMYTPPPH